MSSLKLYLTPDVSKALLDTGAMLVYMTVSALMDFPVCRADVYFFTYINQYLSLTVTHIMKGSRTGQESTFHRYPDV